MASLSANSNSLTEASFKRKERLRALREKALKSAEANKDGGHQLQKPTFRSYKPQNENTNGEVLPQEPTGDIELAVQSQLELLKEPLIIDEIDINNLAPRKPDWDLKRDVTKKLELLDRRTQKAIAELIRERLENNQNQPNLCQAVNVATAHVQDKPCSED